MAVVYGRILAMDGYDCLIIEFSFSFDCLSLFFVSRLPHSAGLSVDKNTEVPHSHHSVSLHSPLSPSFPSASPGTVTARPAEHKTHSSDSPLRVSAGLE